MTPPQRARRIRKDITDYILRSQSGRDVFACVDEQSARTRMAEMAARGTRLRLFKVDRHERELAA